MTEKLSGLEEWMCDRDKHPPDDNAGEKALAEWMAYQSRLDRMTPAEREQHEREMNTRKRKRDDEGYGLEILYDATNVLKRRNDDDSDEQR